MELYRFFVQFINVTYLFAIIPTQSITEISTLSQLFGRKVLATQTELRKNGRKNSEKSEEPVEMNVLIQYDDGKLDDTSTHYGLIST